MRTIYTPQQTKSLHTTLVVFAAILMVGCSGYQSVSYYGDGIYGETPMPQPRQEVASPQQAPQQQSGTYYKNYFADKANQGIQDGYIFTNPEQYQNPIPKNTSAGNYQAHGSWGDQAERINVNIINNRPFGWNWGWGWYDAPFTFGRSAFWGYNYHPWYFTFDHFHNPYYNPYRWGYHSPYWNRWNRWDRWGYYPPPITPYWDRYYNRRVYNNGPIYSRLNGGRGQSSISRTYSRGSNVQDTSVERTQTNSNSDSLRNKMRRRSQSNSDYSTNSTRTSQQNTTTSRSRSSNNSYNNRANNNSNFSRNNQSNSNSGYYRSSRSSSSGNYSRASSGSLGSSSTSSSSRSSSSRRR